MRKLISLVLLLVCFAISVSAKETVVYQNDFSSSNLSDFTVIGSAEVKDGLLKATATGTNGKTAFVSYNMPAQYNGKDFIVEADYVGVKTTGGSIGGITVGGAGASGATNSFLGYAIATTKALSKLSGATNESTMEAISLRQTR